MGIFFKISKRLYRALIPKSWRDSPFVLTLKYQLLPHDWIYNSNYYEESTEVYSKRSAPIIASSICEFYEPMSAIDVGCGTGALLEELRNKGCEVFGLEYSEAGLKHCRRRKLNVSKFNLKKDNFKKDITFDIAISMEVAEHLPVTVADRFVDLLTQLSSVVIFTAAQPGQGGVDHVNEQPRSYWIAKFKKRGFEYAEEQTLQWSKSWQSTEVANWYVKNLMIFEKRNNKQ